LQMRPLSYALTVLVAAACESPSTMLQAPPVRFEADAWAGGSVRLTSSGFRTAATVRVVFAGHSLPLRPIDDSTLAADVPDTNGVILLSVELNGVPAAEGRVTLHGLESTRPLPHFDGNLLAWPLGTGTLLGSVGGWGLHSGRLNLIDPAAGTTTPFLDDSLFDGSCGSPMIGFGPDGGRVLILSAYDDSLRVCRVRAVDATPPGTVVDTPPPFIHGFSPSVGGVRLPGGHWVESSKQWLQLARREPWGYTDSQLTYYAAERFAASATGEFVVPIGGGVYPPDWVPVFRAATVFSPLPLPGIREDRSAVFTPSGDTLFVQRGSDVYRTPDSLFVVDARAGSFLQALGATRPFDDLVADVGRPWLYAVTADSIAGGATITIYDRRTMQVVAVQHATGSAPWNLSDGSAFLALDVAGRRLHVVLCSQLAGGSEPSVGFTFSLLP
jgi:hypothetical protein